VPVVPQGGGSGDFVAPVPRAPGDTFSAYISFALFGGAGTAPGLSPSLLFPALAGKSPGAGPLAAATPRQTSNGTHSSGGALGAAYHKLAPGSGSWLSPWLRYLAIPLAVTALATLAVLLLRRRNMTPV
jgi:hypothetical protein